MSNLYQDAILDAKALRASAMANAKAALEEAFEPKIQEMLRLKLSEELDEVEELEEVDELEEKKDEVSETELEEKKDGVEEVKHDEVKEEYSEDSEDDLIKLLSITGIIIILTICILNIIL